MFANDIVFRDYKYGELALGASLSGQVHIKGDNLILKLDLFIQPQTPPDDFLFLEEF